MRLKISACIYCYIGHVSIVHVLCPVFVSIVVGLNYNRLCIDVVCCCESFEKPKVFTYTSEEASLCRFANRAALKITDPASLSLCSV